MQSQTPTEAATQGRSHQPEPVRPALLRRNSLPYCERAGLPISSRPGYPSVDVQEVGEACWPHEQERQALAIARAAAHFLGQPAREVVRAIGAGDLIPGRVVLQAQTLLVVPPRLHSHHKAGHGERERANHQRLLRRGIVAFPVGEEHDERPADCDAHDGSGRVISERRQDDWDEVERPERRQVPAHDDENGDERA